MKHKILLFIVLVLMAWLMIFTLTGCSTTEESLPECTMATIEPKGDKWCVTVMSDSPSVTMCRNIGSREVCWTIVSHYYQCINIETSIGEIITFEDDSVICQLTVR